MMTMSDQEFASTPQAGLMPGALSGVRVLDISNFLAAPMSTMFLADFGADVIKVERPGRGDELRFWGENKDGVGLYYKVINRNKRSITLDLHTPLGVDAVKKLVADVDIVVENYRPGTLEKWGLGYDVLSAINPKLIMMRVTGYGQTGPYSARPGFGTLAEAYAGYVNITGTPESSPLLPGFGLADATTGLMAAFLALTALHEQRRTGKGQVVDLAIYETLLTLIGPNVVNYDQLGLIQQRQGSRLPFVAPRNIYRTRDNEWVSIAGSSQRVFERICGALDVPQVALDERFLDNRLRLKNSVALDDELMAAVACFDLADILERFDKAEAAISAVYNVEQIFNDPHIKARKTITAVDDEELGQVRMQNVVGKFSRTPGAIRHAGPQVGQHNREILVNMLGYSEEELAALNIKVDLNTGAAAC
jgi:crotonobetainyl-CoA:carnitine CoA-transferase CaiB-like acyl-CoA transferase